MPTSLLRVRGYGYSWDEWLLAFLVPATVVCATLGSGSLASVQHAGLLLRWVALGLLGGAALVFALPDRAAVPRSLALLLGALAGVSILSAAWSVAPRSSFEHAVTFVWLSAVVLLIGAGTRRSLRRLELVCVALVAGPVLVALAGVALVVFDHSIAVQAPEPGMPARLRGLGQDPNTSSLLFSLAIPILVGWLVRGPSRLKARLPALATIVLLYGSILASGSRGAMVSAVFGAAVTVVVLLRWTRLTLLAETFLALVVVLSIGIAGSRPSTPAASTQPSSIRTQPSSGHPSTAPAPATQVAPWWNVALRPTVSRSSVPVPFVPETDELGNPLFYVYKPLLMRGSGRVFAWIYAIRQGLQRPALGYGFATERGVFVDRFYYFDGDYTENSYVGMFLQLGIVGVGLLLAFVVLTAVSFRRVLRSVDSTVRFAGAVGLGMAAAGLAVGLFQSYFYSVGNVATLTFWTGLAIGVTWTARWHTLRPSE